MIIALDPGKNIGLALVSFDRVLLDSTIVTLEQLKTYVFREGLTVVLGDGTGSKGVRAMLDNRGIDYVLVDEEGSSLEARAHYFAAHPATGLWRLLPKSMWPVNEPLDNYAAYVIALRYLDSLGLEN